MPLFKFIMFMLWFVIIKAIVSFSIIRYHNLFMHRQIELVKKKKTSKKSKINKQNKNRKSRYMDFKSSQQLMDGIYSLQYQLGIND